MRIYTHYPYRDESENRAKYPLVFKKELKNLNKDLFNLRKTNKPLEL